MSKKALASLIDHVVIVVKENHTFDNYFGTFPGADGEKLKHAQDPPPDDPNHRHEAWMARKNDTAHKVQYTKADIPPYFALARQYTLCDRYFSEVAGPSTPNHLMLIAADAPIINNPHHHYRPGPKDTYKLQSLPSALEKAGITWGNFGGYAFHYIEELAGHPSNHPSDMFAHLAQKGTLPAVSWLYAEGKPSLSEHPPQVVSEGAAWTARQIQALVDGGLWDRTAIFITWDDWGGWFDHVVPPQKETCVPAVQRAAVPLRLARPLPGGQPLRQARTHLLDGALAHQPGQVLRDALGIEVHPAKAPRCGRHAGLLRCPAAATPRTQVRLTRRRRTARITNWFWNQSGLPGCRSTRSAAPVPERSETRGGRARTPPAWSPGTSRARRRDRPRCPRLRC
jgi:phospholipase C